jgi:ribonuclease P protein component
MVWYYRGNVIHLQPKKEKAQNHPWFFGAPGNADRPTRPFPPTRERPAEIGRLKEGIMRLPSDEFRARGYKTISTPFFLLKIKKNSYKTTRVGIVVGVSVNKAAAKRNFWKRQARAEIALRAADGSDILMMVSPNVRRLTKKQFREEVAKTLAAAQQK